MAQQAQQAQQEFAQQQLAMQARHDQQERENEMERQRLEITKSYHEQQIQIRQQQLQEAQKMNTAKTEAAAAQAAARMRIEQRVADGEDFNTVMMQEGPGAGFGGAAMASLGRNQQQLQQLQGKQAYIPEEMTTESGQSYYRGAPTSPWAPAKPEPRKPVDSLENTGVAIMEREIAKAEDLIDTTPKMDAKIKAAMEASLDAKKRRVNAVFKKRGDDPPYPGAEESAATKSIKIVRDPKTGKLVVTGGGTTTATTPPARPIPETSHDEEEEPARVPLRVPPLTWDMFPPPSQD
jgi:hypothetical protein